MGFKFASSFVRSLLNPGTAPLPSITFAGDENTGIYSPGADQVGISTAGTARVVVDSSGNVGIGTTGPAVRLDVVSAAASPAQITAYRNSVAGATLSLRKSKSDTAGTNTIGVADDAIGAINFTATDGTNFIQAASIQALIDGTPGTNDMPGRLSFSTTADGASVATERMRIDNAGLITGTGTSLGAWTAYTPTLGGTGWAIGNGTSEGWYCQIGKIVHFKTRTTFGTTSTFGSATLTLSLPVTGKSGQTGGWQISANFTDTSASSNYVGATYITNTTTIAVSAISSSVGLVAPVISTTPFTWASTDVIYLSGTYEAA